MEIPDDVQVIMPAKTVKPTYSGAAFSAPRLSVELRTTCTRMYVVISSKRKAATKIIKGFENREPCTPLRRAPSQKAHYHTVVSSAYTLKFGYFLDAERSKIAVKTFRGRAVNKGGTDGCANHLKDDVDRASDGLHSSRDNKRHCDAKGGVGAGRGVSNKRLTQKDDGYELLSAGLALKARENLHLVARNVTHSQVKRRNKDGPMTARALAAL